MKFFQNGNVTIVIYKQGNKMIIEKDKNESELNFVKINKEGKRIYTTKNKKIKVIFSVANEPHLVCAPCEVTIVEK